VVRGRAGRVRGRGSRHPCARNPRGRDPLQSVLPLHGHRAPDGSRRGHRHRGPDEPARGASRRRPRRSGGACPGAAGKCASSRYQPHPRRPRQSRHGGDAGLPRGGGGRGVPTRWPRGFRVGRPPDRGGVGGTGRGVLPVTGAGPARSDDEERRDTVLQGTWIVGCGDIGRRMLARYRAAGVQCVAVTRSAASAEAATALGARVFTLDLDHPERWPDTGPDGAAVVYLAPPPREGTRDPRIRAFLDRHGANIRRLVLVSTTGVYGDCGGAWIDEDTPPAPATDRGRRRLDPENAARAWAARTGGGLVILRVPGIYSGDRLPVDRLRKALPVVRESESAFTNRVHAEDLARICMAAVESREPLLVLNATDGHPT